MRIEPAIMPLVLPTDELDFHTLVHFNLIRLFETNEKKKRKRKDTSVERIRKFGRTPSNFYSQR
jgi:hypothetical protein